MADQNIYDLPSTPRAEYVEAAKDLTLIRDLLAGTRRMHDRFKEYIAKYSKEQPMAYKRRATSAKVYGGLQRTLSAAVGMLFAKPPELSDSWTDELRTHAENIDGKGTKLSVFAKRNARDAIGDGYVGILVDHPEAPEGVTVHAGNEEALNLRPFWSTYTRANVISWVTGVVNNVETLLQVVLREGSSERVGKFGVKPVVRYRVCSLQYMPDPIAKASASEPQWIAGWQVLEERRSDDGQVTVVPIGSPGVFRDRAGAPFGRIPFAVPYGGHVDAMLVAQPPLLEVAWANLEHWRVATNLRYYEDLCCFPQPHVKGELAKDENGRQVPLVIGPTTYVQTAADSDFKFAELAGTSLTQLRDSLEEKKDEIGELGMSFLAKKTRGVETAEAKRLDATAENATLATSAQGIEDGLNLALEFHAQYLGIPKAKAPTITINTDFDLVAMDPSTMAVYVQAVVQAGLPARTMLEAWQQGGRLPADTDIDQLEAQMLASAAAIDEQKRLEAENNKFPTAA